jgi:hypothetical protein
MLPRCGRVFDPRKFKIYIVDRRVWKGYDYVILPDGDVVKVRPGKYMRVTARGFSFEDMTEELNQEPDYDYDEPSCSIESASGFLVKTVKLRCSYGSSYNIRLYYGAIKVHEFERGFYDKDISFKYIDRTEAVIASAVAGLVGGGATYYLRRDARLGLGVGIAITILGSIASYIGGE